MSDSGNPRGNPAQPPGANDDSQTLPRVLGLFSAVTVVVGSIIGSGIFLKTGNVATALGSFGPIIGVWIGVGVITLCGSLALAELAAMMPHAGGPYVYLREAFGPLSAFLWGWTEFWVVRTGSLGALSCATVIYLASVVPMERGTQEILAIAIVVGLTVINIISTRWGAGVQNITTVIKVGFLGAIILLPLLMGQTEIRNLDPVWPQAADGSLWKGLGVAMIAVLWPYDGWINVAPVAEEIRNPQRNVPLGLGLGMLIVIIVYVGANISYHLTMPMEHVKGSDAIASDVFRQLFGGTGAKIAALGVMCSTFGAVNSNLLTGPRIYFAMARDGLLPASISRVHNSYRTPANAVLIQGVWATVLLVVFYGWKESPKDAFDGLTDSVIFGGLIFYGMAVASVYVLRVKRPDLARPYKTWGYPVTPALLLLAYCAAFVSLVIERYQETAGVVALIVAGFVFYCWSSRQPRARQAADARASGNPPGPG
jgi:basic amino acid/polyamine antiporter, APA family